jgi:hypothetical protein
MHALATHWYIPLIVSVVCFLYIRWKGAGGNLLFRFKKTDDAAQTIWKGLFYLVWTFISVYGAIVIGFASFVVFIVALIAFATGS